MSEEETVSLFNIVFSVKDVTRLILSNIGIENLFRFSRTCRLFSRKDWLISHCDFILLASTLETVDCETMVWIYNKGQVKLPELVLTDHNIDAKQNNYAYALVLFYLSAYNRQERCFFRVMNCLLVKERNDEIYTEKTLSLLEKYEMDHTPYSSIFSLGGHTPWFEVIFDRITGEVAMLLTTNEFKRFDNTSHIEESLVLSHESIHCIVKCPQFVDEFFKRHYHEALPILKEKFRLGCLDDARRYSIVAQKFNDLMESIKLLNS